MTPGGNTRASLSEPGGTKHDEGKPDLSILPYSALRELAHVMSYGAAKYGRDNYKKGFVPHRLIAAALRHLYSYNEGEELDESGYSHLAHAIANCAMLLELEKENKQ